MFAAVRGSCTEEKFRDSRITKAMCVVWGLIWDSDMFLSKLDLDLENGRKRVMVSAICRMRLADKKKTQVLLYMLG